RPLMPTSLVNVAFMMHSPCVAFVGASFAQRPPRGKYLAPGEGASVAEQAVERAVDQHFGRIRRLLGRQRSFLAVRQGLLRCRCGLLLSSRLPGVTLAILQELRKAALHGIADGAGDDLLG